MSGLLERLLERRSTLAVPDRFLTDFFTGGVQSQSGVTVSPEVAMGYIPYVAAVKIIAESVATLPLPLYRRITNGRYRDFRHPLYSVLHDQANPEMTAFEFREILTAHCCSWGNGYAEKLRGGDGQVRELWPLRPDHMTVRRNEERQIEYVYRIPGQNVSVVLPRSEVFHLRGLSFDGLVGYSVIKSHAREAIGLGLAAEQFGERFFANDARPGVYFLAPKGMTKEAKENFIRRWRESHEGSGSSHRTAVLEDGMDIKTVGIPPEDAQFLETRRFQVQEIARLFRIPPHMLGDVTGSTSWGTGIEQQQIGFVSHTLGSWLKRWEQAISRDLILPDERQFVYAEFLVDGFLRGDTAARWTAYREGWQTGVFSPDDIRAMENMNPLPDGAGQTYYVPMNFMPAGTEPPAPEPAPARAAPVAINFSDREVSIEDEEVRKELIALTAQLAAMVASERDRPITIEMQPKIEILQPAAPPHKVRREAKRNSKGQITEVIETFVD